MYQHGKRVQRPHNYKVLFATVSIIGVVVSGSWFMIHKDIGNATGPQSNVPIISTVSSSNGGTITINETLFSMELPKDWRLRDQVHASYRNSWTWGGTKKDGNDRTLTLHIDIMPVGYKLVKLLPITPNGNKFILGSVSDDCINFSGGPGVSQKTGDNAPFQAKWQDVNFICDPISSNQSTGTGSKEHGIGVPLTGSKGTHTYFFFFEDHNVRPDTTILRDVLSTFEIK